MTSSYDTFSSLSSVPRTWTVMNEIFTIRLSLRRIQEPDLPLLCKWSNSERYNGPYLTPERMSMQTCLEKLNNDYFWNDDARIYIIQLKKERRPVGTIQYWKKQGTSFTVCMTVRIAEPAERGKGYGTEAQKVLVRQLFLVAGYEDVEMHTDIDNIAQQRCLEKIGFEFVSSQVFLDNGIERLGRLYRMNRTQYESSPGALFYYE